MEFGNAMAWAKVKKPGKTLSKSSPGANTHFWVLPHLSETAPQRLSKSQGMARRAVPFPRRSRHHLPRKRRLRRLSLGTPTARRPYPGFHDRCSRTTARKLFFQPPKNTHFWVLRVFPQFADSFTNLRKKTSSELIQTNIQTR